MPPLSIGDRCVYALIGAVFGALYGVLLALLAMVISANPWNIAYVEATAIVFGALAFLVGPFVGDAIAGVLHLLWGFIGALGFLEFLADTGTPARRPAFLAALFWFGVATAVAIFLPVRVW